MAAAAAFPDSFKLTVDSEALFGCLGTDRVADTAGILSSITSSGWIENQRAVRDGDPGVVGDAGTSFAPLDCDLRPGRPCTLQRYISFLNRYCGNRQTDPSHCVYRESKACFIKELHVKSMTVHASQVGVTEQ